MGEPAQQEFWIADSEKVKRFEDEYIRGDAIGRGHFSTVYRCLHRGRTEWACKKIKKKGRKERKMTESEIVALKQLRHPHIISMKEIFETADDVFVILEMAKGGELFQRIVEQGHYSEKDAARLVRQILLALQYLHDRKIVHRDIKPENLLFANESSNSPVKLSDFGLSKLLEDGDETMKTMCGTVGYSAPEVLLGEPYTSAVDIWSVGVITYVLLCGYEPFWDEAGDVAVCQKVVEGEFTFDGLSWEDVSSSAKDLIRKLLEVKPSDRLTASEALEDPWVKGETGSENHLAATLSRIREVNARRKFKAATHAVLATQRMGISEKFCKKDTDPNEKNGHAS